MTVSAGAPPPDRSRYRIGVDVGGTFTDLVAVDEAGHISFLKVPSTPEDQSIGVMDGLARLADRLGLGLDGLLARTERIVHGMTVATNALLERKGAVVGLLTTAGHRDVLEMREGLKPGRYDLRLPRAAPLVPRHLRLGVVERLRADGSVETPLDPGSLEKAVRSLARARVEAVAICCLHAYRDGRHERLMRDAVTRALPEAYVCLSSEILPQIKEFERVSTTVVNAYVGPLIERYLRGLEERLAAAGYRNPLLIILSHGGVAPVSEAVRVAAGTVLSGPAGGLAAARHLAGQDEVADLIAFDMGGTSTDISLVIDGQAALASDRKIAEERIALPSLDIITLGAGGGSIARADAGGLLQVGPESAGAEPGPACYGKSGTAATVTDASLVLGYLDPDRFLGGRSRLDRAAAEAALDRLAAALGVDRLQAAEGVHRVVNTQMAEGVRLATVRRGIDPRRLTLLGFGGAAGLQVTALARLLQLERVLVPREASVLSAWGMLTTELRTESQRTHIGDTGSLDAAAVRDLFQDLAAEARERLAAWFDGSIRTRPTADMRYGEQVYEIDVPLDTVDFDAPDLMDCLRRAFEARHEALFTYSLEAQDPVLVNARVAAVGTLGLPAPPRPAGDTQPVPASGVRPLFLGGWCDAPVYAFDRLAPGQVVDGPALIDSDTTTVLLRPGDRATLAPLGWLDIAITG